MRSPLFAAVMAAMMLLPVSVLAADERPALLKALDGPWIMRGDVRGKPVSYTMRAGPGLQDKFTEMHMVDVQQPPRYEARVFLGMDGAGQKVIAHWLDSFGAGSSVPHATGTLAGNVIEITFPYAGGAFRDTFTYQPEQQGWLFELEAARPDGGWQHFARYVLRRPPAADGAQPAQ